MNQSPDDAPIRFILDDALGSLLKWLRMLGFDTIFRRNRECEKPIAETVNKREIYLTLSRSVCGKEMEKIIHLEQDAVAVQLHYIIAACGITRESVKPFSRCIICNKEIQGIDKTVIRGRIPDYVWQTHEIFRECPACRRIYWRGTHAEKINRTIQEIFEGGQEPRGHAPDGKTPLSHGVSKIMDKVIALGSRLKDCKNVLTLGVYPNFSDYSPEERRMIQTAPKIYYPTQLYAELFDSMNKPTFPNAHNYTCAQDKIKQSVLLNLLDIPHPRTRVFYGKRQKTRIKEYFSFPFIAKIPRGSAMGSGVFLIQNHTALNDYLDLGTPAYIQEYLPVHHDMRIVVIGKKIVHAYRRIAASGEFRNNIARGAKISLENLPEAALDLALQTARLCQWDDVGVDICECQGKLYVLEGNMKYGREGFRAAGIDYIGMLERMIENKEI